MLFCGGNSPTVGIQETLARPFGGRLDAAHLPTPDDKLLYPGENPSATFIENLKDSLLDLFYPHGDNVATPTMAFSYLARTAIDAALMCATTILSDGTMSKLFLMDVGAPTALCRGHTRTKLWKGDSPHTLLPDKITGPTKVTFLTFATLTPASRDTSSAMETCTPQFYLQAHEKVCFSEDGYLYKFLLAPATTSPCDQASYTVGHPGLAQKIWYKAEHAATIQVPGLKKVTPVIQGTDPAHAVTYSLLPTMLPLRKSLDIPIGPIRDATLGALGVWTRFARLLRQPDAPYWLDHPVVIDWLNAVVSAPSQFVNPWYARSWIHDSVKPDPMPAWNNPADDNI
jgi:hypothetical protein